MISSLASKYKIGIVNSTLLQDQHILHLAFLECYDRYEVNISIAVNEFIKCSQNVF